MLGRVYDSLVDADPVETPRAAGAKVAVEASRLQTCSATDSASATLRAVPLRLLRDMMRQSCLESPDLRGTAARDGAERDSRMRRISTLRDPAQP